MYTGRADPYSTRTFIFKDGQSVINYKPKCWNGYEIITELRSPFREWVQIKGSDGMQVKPFAERS
jgi:hypothetical protein